MTNLSRPQRPNRPNQANPANNPNRGRNNDNRGNRNNRGNNNNNNNQPPSPWLDPNNEPQPHQNASFIEYLRWMRSPDSNLKDATKVQILQMAQEKAKNNDRLKQLNERTKIMAGENNSFKVQCPWRIRVGGHRGPESILLPAFDALGMPFIPASTLRGVARTQAIREYMTKNNVTWSAAEKAIAPYFGALDSPKPEDQAGKIIFFDAYPVPSKNGGLTMDMANNIWNWDNNQLQYSPNPNPFLSLQNTTFLIGLKLASNCNDPEILSEVKRWLIKGLQTGVGSQVNSGYGRFVLKDYPPIDDKFFQVNFALAGQLIHGHQEFSRLDQPYRTDRNGNLRSDTKPIEEVRPTAFKSMLRYWFRVFALGVLEQKQVKEWEAKLFGSIDPQEYGLVKFNIIKGKVEKSAPRSNYQGRNDDYGEQTGILVLSYSNSPDISEANKLLVKELFKTLTWLMFRLGGIGQGARRPCYSRQNRENAPWFRGSTLYPEPERESPFWKLPSEPSQFADLLAKKIRTFYTTLGELIGQTNLINSPLKTVGQANQHQWAEAVDKNCQILVVSGDKHSDKPYALDVLHQQFHQLEQQRKFTDAKSLCGGVKNDRYFINDHECKRDVCPSPIWIADLDKYQIVTVFGAKYNPRKDFIDKLRQKNCFPVFPLSEN